MTESVPDFSDAELFYDQPNGDTNRIVFTGTELAAAANGRYIAVAGGEKGLVWRIVEADGHVAITMEGGETRPLGDGILSSGGTFTLMDVEATNDDSFVIVYQTKYKNSDNKYIYHNYELIVNNDGEIISSPREIGSSSATSFAISEARDPDGSGALGYQSLIVYADAENGSQEIYGIRVNDAGTLIGSEFQINVGDNANQQYKPSVSTLSNGNYVVVWQTVEGIKGRLVNPDGQLVGTLVTVNEITAGAEEAPEVTSLSNGNFVVAWEVSGGGSTTGTDLHFRMFSASGQALTTEKAASTILGGNQNQGTILATEDGGFAIAWREDGTGIDEYIIQYFDAAGNTMGDTLKLFQTDKNNADVEFAMLADGRIALTWIQNDGNVLSVDAVTKIVDPRTSGIVKIGTSGDDIYMGSRFDDTLRGMAGDDRLEGRDGNDALRGGVGADFLDGGAGIDVAYYNDATSAVTVNLLNEALNAGDALGDHLQLVENIYGSAYDDLITGDTLANTLTGWNGNDRLNGGDGNDTLKGSFGDDALNGGDGRDIADYSDDTSGFTGDLLDSSRNTGRLARDNLISIEGLIGSNYSDSLSGTNSINVLIGGGGNDFLRGRNGSDQLTGGTGADKFVLNDPTHGVDTIFDFRSSEGDKIVIDIVTDAASDQFGGTLQVTGSSGLSGGVLLVHTSYSPTSTKTTFFYDTDDQSLWYDVDGSGAASRVQIATIANFTALHADDFLII